MRWPTGVCCRSDGVCSTPASWRPSRLAGEQVAEQVERLAHRALRGEVG